MKTTFRQNTADVGEFGDNGQRSHKAEWKGLVLKKRVRDKASLREEYKFISMSIMQ